ncbi:hypothetical protein EHS13_30450 [Paenibacillus psychroresistens]|uniref:Uncharacterized protein n=1 Tax=Paenibacillus psychroresistens TaxID=1778678 RepID=A0A6B8RTW8_9BACL|nr:hypothetical protein [Paenibacillus psychroresistens]QGQ98893.1 hypothetical protein EHS13_30450 [Paenibacillus psychroresistens]
MKVSSSISVSNQYLSSTSTQKVHHKHSTSNSAKTQDTVELSAEAKAKYAETQGNLSSDFDPTTELSAADQKELLSQLKSDLSSSTEDDDMPAELKAAIASVQTDLSSVGLETASDADISALLTKVIATFEAAKTSDSEASGSGRPIGGPGGPPPPPGGGAGKSSASSDDSDTIQSLLDVLTDEEDTNGDGVVDEKDEQTTASKAATELKSKLTDWLAGDKTTTVGSYDSLVQQLSYIDSNQEESAS